MVQTPCPIRMLYQFLPPIPGRHFSCTGVLFCMSTYCISFVYQLSELIKEASLRYCNPLPQDSLCVQGHVPLSPEQYSITPNTKRRLFFPLLGPFEFPIDLRMGVHVTPLHPLNPSLHAPLPHFLNAFSFVTDSSFHGSLFSPFYRLLTCSLFSPVPSPQ